jgi:diamine N-acetyltransferase
MTTETNTQLHIRYATSLDNALLAELGAQAFYDSYIAQINPERMASYLITAFSPEFQALELTEPTTRFLIGEIDGAVAGYAKLRFELHHSAVAEEKIMEIDRLYVCHGWIGKGVGSQFMSACLAEAVREECDLVRLAVWEHNLRARAFYRKWNFVEAGEQLFQFVDEVQRDLTMMRSLVRSAYTS